MPESGMLRPRVKAGVSQGQLAQWGHLAAERVSPKAARMDTLAGCYAFRTLHGAVPLLSRLERRKVGDDKKKHSERGQADPEDEKRGRKCPAAGVGFS
jgi:hypothetical protein